MDWNNIFNSIIQMSLTSSIVILLVIFARLCLKRVPKIYSYVLWTVVLFRLLCPVSISSEYSFLGMLQNSQAANDNISNVVKYEALTTTSKEETENALPTYQQEMQTNSTQQMQPPIVEEHQEREPMTGYVWLAGVVVMFSISFISYMRLKRKLIGAIKLRDNIYMADHILTPFVMGLFCPRIYLFSSLEEREQEYIILHEKHHIRRGDHIIKALAYLALCIHWFNPLVWVAFSLAMKDMEMSCDEAVILKKGEGIRTDYSVSLLVLSVERKMFFGTPLAFGEGNTKERIQNLAKWKKPGVLGMIMAAVACVVVCWMGAVNPKDTNNQTTEPFGHDYRVEKIIAMSGLSSFSRSEDSAPLYALTEDFQLFERDNYGNEEWSQLGGFREIELTKENFDDFFDYMLFFHPYLDTTAEELRKDNKKAWRLIVEEDEAKSACYYLLLQKNKEVYLISGEFIQENVDFWEPEDSYFEYVYKLTRTDLLSCTANSEGLEVYIEPVYYPKGFGGKNSNESSGQIWNAGELVFTADWETDILTVEEEYYERRGDSVEIVKKTYALQKDEDGQFTLKVERRNPNMGEEVFYFIQAEKGCYAMKIDLPVKNDLEDKHENTTLPDWGLEIVVKDVHRWD